MKVLVLNCGSSSVKFQLVETDEAKARAGSDRALAKGLVENIGGTAILRYEGEGVPPVKETAEILEHKIAVERILALLTRPGSGVIRDRAEIEAVGHRMVHGGEHFKSSVLIDDAVLRAIEECFDIAPLHNPPNVKGYRAARDLMRDAPHVAVFDTAFHQTMEPVAFLYALPYVALRAPRDPALRVPRDVPPLRVPARGRDPGPGGRPPPAARHLPPRQRLLGRGDPGRTLGRHVHGLHPARGPGDGQPERRPRSRHPAPRDGEGGARRGGDERAPQQALGPPRGVGPQQRHAQAARGRGAGNERARLAVDMFCYRLRKYIASYVGVLGGLDALVFTGGIGENAAPVRERSVAGLSAMGVTHRPGGERRRPRPGGRRLAGRAAPAACSWFRPTRSS